MPRYSYVYTADGRSFLKGSPEHLEYIGESYGAPAVFGDEGDFRSPVDGKLYSGKLGMREHNARHDTVNWRDCKGLPTELPKVAPDRRAIREAIIESARRGGHLEGQ